MTEEQKLILAVIFFIASVIALIIVLIYTKKVVKKEKEIVDSLEKESIDFYTNLKLIDNKYFPRLSATLLVQGASPLIYKEACTLH